MLHLAVLTNRHPLNGLVPATLSLIDYEMSCSAACSKDRQPRDRPTSVSLTKELPAVSFSVPHDHVDLLLLIVVQFDKLKDKHDKLEHQVADSHKFSQSAECLQIRQANQVAIEIDLLLHQSGIIDRL